MKTLIGKMGYLVMAAGLVGVVIGVVFIGQALSKQYWMQDAMVKENISLAYLGIQGPNANTIIKDMDTALTAADTVRTHRHTIAPSYKELLGSGKYDPTDPKQLTYAQAMNLENYLYLAVLGFGVVLIALGAGAFMIVTGLGLGITGCVLVMLDKRTAAKAA
jgi:hypothetical protein